MDGRGVLVGSGDVLGFVGEEDHERSKWVGWLNDEGGLPLRGF